MPNVCTPLAGWMVANQCRASRLPVARLGYWQCWEQGLIDTLIQANRDYAILYWDPAMNEGGGGWLELPTYDLDPDGVPVVTELHDGMTVLSGVHLSPDGLRVQATVNFTGLFVLVRE